MHSTPCAPTCLADSSVSLNCMPSGVKVSCALMMARVSMVVWKVGREGVWLRGQRL